MAIRKILVYPHKTLRKAAEPVRKFGEPLAQLALDLQQTMRAASGIGLAATQVGITKRVVAVRAPGDDDPRQDIIAVNPEIIDSDGTLASDEGCLSVPGVRAKLKRAARARVRYREVDGTSRTLELEGHLAVVFQHEIDHLDGILFWDHLSRLKRNMLLRQYRNLQRREAGDAA